MAMGAAAVTRTSGGSASWNGVGRGYDGRPRRSSARTAHGPRERRRRLPWRQSSSLEENSERADLFLDPLRAGTGGKVAARPNRGAAGRAGCQGELS